MRNNSTTEERNEARYNPAMKRFGRWLLNCLTALSLLACTAMLFLWFSGYLLGWEGVWENPHSDGWGESTFTFEFSAGGVGVSEFSVTVDPARRSPDFKRFYDSVPRSPTDRSWHRLDNSDYPSRWQDSARRWAFFWQTGAQGWDIAYRRELIVPAWFTVVLFLILPTIRLLSRKRPQVGVCVACGYDLRATPDRCPECGTIPAKVKSRA